MDYKDEVDPIVGGDLKWPFNADYSYFDARGESNNVLNEFGWNYDGPVVDRVGSSNNVVVVGSVASTDDEVAAGNVSKMMSNRLDSYSSSSDQDRPESSTASGGSGGKRKRRPTSLGPEESSRAIPPLSLGNSLPFWFKGRALPVLINS